MAYTDVYVNTASPIRAIIENATAEVTGPDGEFYKVDATHGTTHAAPQDTVKYLIGSTDWNQHFPSTPVYFHSTVRANVYLFIKENAPV